MKVPCNIIEDLLPLYHDNVCSEESRAMVKEHLQTCRKVSDAAGHDGRQYRRGRSGK